MSSEDYNNVYEHVGTYETMISTKYYMSQVKNMLQPLTTKL